MKRKLNVWNKQNKKLCNNPVKIILTKKISEKSDELFEILKSKLSDYTIPIHLQKYDDCFIYLNDEINTDDYNWTLFVDPPGGAIHNVGFILATRTSEKLIIHEIQKKVIPTFVNLFLSTKLLTHSLKNVSLAVNKNNWYPDYRIDYLCDMTSIKKSNKKVNIFGNQKNFLNSVLKNKYYYTKNVQKHDLLELYDQLHTVYTRSEDMNLYNPSKTCEKDDSLAYVFKYMFDFFSL